MKMASLQSMVFPLPSVSRPWGGRLHGQGAARLGTSSAEARARPPRADQGLVPLGSLLSPLRCHAHARPESPQARRHLLSGTSQGTQHPPNTFSRRPTLGQALCWGTGDSLSL